jgi:hypothetical protein
MYSYSFIIIILLIVQNGFSSTPDQLLSPFVASDTIKRSILISPPLVMNDSEKADAHAKRKLISIDEEKSKSIKKTKHKGRNSKFTVFDKIEKWAVEIGKIDEFIACNEISITEGESFINNLSCMKDILNSVIRLQLYDFLNSNNKLNNEIKNNSNNSTILNNNSILSDSISNQSITQKTGCYEFSFVEFP